jgi:hypothetical protein
MTWTPTLRSALVLSSALALAGCALADCGFGTPIGQQHPSVQGAPPTPDDSEEARRGTALHTAAGDLGCTGVELVLAFDRRYSNAASVRYVIEGCGKRAVYAETCEDYPRCRYLLLSVVPVPVPLVPAPVPVPLVPAPRLPPEPGPR